MNWIDLENWLAVYLADNVGPVHFAALLKRFANPQNILSASEKELLEVPGIGLKTVTAIHNSALREKARKQLAAVKEYQASVLTLADEDYPALLRQIYDPPPVLFVAGSLAKDDGQAIAIVGSRMKTDYGLSITNRLALELAQLGFTIVSGFARGIDSAAHEAALAAGGRSIGVLGCGLDILYPLENKDLKARLVQQGALISEFPFGTAPEPGNFPRRNRIISGLALGVIVIEAGAQSGALITARHALEQGREVFAIPGNVFARTSQGTNALIKDGAKLVMTVDDILSELTGMAPVKKGRIVPAAQPIPEPSGLSDIERRMYAILSDDPLHIDQVAQQAAVTAGEALSVLLSLELKGVIKQLSGKQFIRHPEVGLRR